MTPCQPEPGRANSTRCQIGNSPQCISRHCTLDCGRPGHYIIYTSLARTAYCTAGRVKYFLSSLLQSNHALGSFANFTDISQAYKDYTFRLGIPVNMYLIPPDMDTMRILTPVENTAAITPFSVALSGAQSRRKRPRPLQINLPFRL